MGNCDNLLFIDGPAPSLREFAAQLPFCSPGTTDSRAFSLAVIDPMPEHLKNDPNSDEAGEWLKSNWGCSGKVRFFEMKRPEGGGLIYTFTTEDYPPRPWVEKLSREYPMLKFTLEYLAFPFDTYGCLEIRNGIVLEDRELSTHSDEFRNPRPEHPIKRLRQSLGFTDEPRPPVT